MGYLRSARLCVAAGLQGVGVEKGRQLLLCMPEVMEHVSQGSEWLVLLSLGVLLEAAGVGGCAHGCERVWWAALGAVYGPVVLGPRLFVVY